ncbi:MAG: diguanylate cyclase [Alphaproteobacteria bacterium]|nr:diguanylate cyclase [Alphaproteobacteria bacterium]
MSETQFKIDAGVLTSSKAAVLVVTSGGEVLASNPSAGVLVEAIRDGHTPEVMGYIGRAAVTGHPMNESVLLPGIGGPVYYELAILPLAAPATVMVFGRDVTLERNLRMALVESRQRYKDLVEISSDFSWETGLDGRFVFVTPRGALGYTADELVGSLPGRLLAEGHENESNLFSTRIAVEDRETWMRHADSGQACVLVSAAPLLGPAGEWRGARGVCRDITQVRERDAALAQASNRERLLTYIVRTIRDEVDPANMLGAAAEATARALSCTGCQIFRAEGGHFSLAANFGDHGLAESIQPMLSSLESGASTAEISLDGWQVLSAVSRYHRDANGAICLWRKAGSALFCDDERLLILDVANQIGIANEQIANHERILNLSRTDGLTGLFNRRAFFEEMERRFNRLARDRKPAALIYVDLDNFKMVNDVHGHQKGDEALLALKDILVHNTRPIDLVSRLGGDEFAVWLENADVEVATKRAQALLEASHPLASFSGTPEKPLGVSLGLAVHDPRRPETLEGMVARADEAMYEVKRAGKGSYKIAKPVQTNEQASP